ncbi:hypothetical protein WN48_03413 [Eufriesea mexicana]|uniref:Uncharacterized protein n=1 Tax=Eufriesea mexicana TaxID=516756 RepID=A0A310SNA1_9HYME|nr:hypothetical protein WN48_03413 [Eufriesea mexicana]
MNENTLHSSRMNYYYERASFGYGGVANRSGRFPDFIPLNFFLREALKKAFERELYEDTVESAKPSIYRLRECMTTPIGIPFESE